MARTDKPLAWLKGEIKTPPFSAAARLEAGVLLRRLQQGELLALPHSRPMPTVGRRCHELRIDDERGSWRIVYGVDPDAVLVLDIPEDHSGNAFACHRELPTPPAALRRGGAREIGRGAL